MPESRTPESFGSCPACGQALKVTTRQTARGIEPVEVLHPMPACGRFMALSAGDYLLWVMDRRDEIRNAKLEN
jgi:hypothetical protein